MKKVIIAAAIALFACAVQANSEKPAAPATQVAANTKMTKEQCDTAMKQCDEKKDPKEVAECKANLQANGCQ